MSFEKVEWRKYDQVRDLQYQLASILSIGILPLAGFFQPYYVRRLKTIKSTPRQADIALVHKHHKYHVCAVDHYTNSVTNEHCAIIEVECIRYCASNQSDYRFLRVPDVPIHFKRFLNTSYGNSHTKPSRSALIEEFRIIKKQYGKNYMSIPESSLMEIGLRQAFSPFYLFQYFAAAVWYAEDYWLYATLILIITFGAIYVTTNETAFNLRNLRLLASSQGSVYCFKRFSDTRDDLESPNNESKFKTMNFLFALSNN